MLHDHKDETERAIIRKLTWLTRALVLYFWATSPYSGLARNRQCINQHVEREQMTWWMQLLQHCLARWHCKASNEREQKHVRSRGSSDVIKLLLAFLDSHSCVSTTHFKTSSSIWLRLSGIKKNFSCNIRTVKSRNLEYETSKPLKGPRRRSKCYPGSNNMNRRAWAKWQSKPSARKLFIRLARPYENILKIKEKSMWDNEN